MLSLIRVGAFGVIGYLTPRILEGLGVPLAEWGFEVGTWLGLSKPWIDQWWLEFVGIIFAILFTAIEWWWRPVQRIWNKFFGDYPLSTIMVQPVAYDVQIHFPDAALLPENNKNDPFKVRVFNIGDHNVTQLILNFDIIGINIRELIEEANIFPRLRWSDDNKVTIWTKQNEQNVWITLPLDMSGKRKIDIIRGHGNHTIEMSLPDEIKNMLSLYMIIESFKKEKNRDHDVSSTMKTMPETWNSKEREEIHKQMIEEYNKSFITIPDVLITATWEDRNKSKKRETIILRSIYHMGSGARWVTDPRPTTPVFYLMGGGGILSYQNQEEPEHGFYNNWANAESEHGAR